MILHSTSIIERCYSFLNFYYRYKIAIQLHTEYKMVHVELCTISFF